MGKQKSVSAETEIVSRFALVARRLILLGTPILLAVIFSFHAAVGDDVYATLASSSETWLTLHLLLLPTFGLLGIALYVLLIGYDGLVATFGRIGIAVYLVFYLAFESIAGVATGIMVREGQELPESQQAVVADLVQTVYSGAGITGAFAFVGTAGYFAAVLAIAVVLRRSGAPVVPLVLLVLSTVAIVAHGSFPSDALGALSFLIAAGWLELGWKGAESPNPARHGTD